ncbi:MAG: hypothetical protein KDJ40_00730 [Hyphomicrobiales bacterium]|nr:hypothetical protein [Hyphomicrobiales bacterium]
MEKLTAAGSGGAGKRMVETIHQIAGAVDGFELGDEQAFDAGELADATIFAERRIGSRAGMGCSHRLER